jgi:hypothetical protein
MRSRLLLTTFSRSNVKRFARASYRTDVLGEERCAVPTQYDAAAADCATHEFRRTPNQLTPEDKITMATETNMREVVERLRADGSEAVLELREFDNALDALLQELERTAPTFQDLHVVTSEIVALRKDEVPAWIAARDQTSRLNTWVNQFLAAFREFRGAVQGWNVPGTGSGSLLPTSGKRLIPRD